ncbi:acyltransferase family protein [Methylobacterium sp. CM6257]
MFPQLQLPIAKTTGFLLPATVRENPSFTTLRTAGAGRHTGSTRREDIDGLRAVAVCCVLLFHFFPSAFPGGFIGVDVFFVISGYVVSLSIIKDLDSEHFSATIFYSKRIRRLYPPLLATIFLSLAASWAIDLGSDFRHAAKDGLVALLYLTNMQLSAGTGYFEPSASTRVFLHLWSLAVEEQFYILWPLVLASVYRSNLRIIAPACVMMASFAAFCALGGEHTNFAFYALPTRAWQFMAGALLAQINRQRSSFLSFSDADNCLASSAIPVISTASILACGIMYSSGGSYAPLIALVPTLGAVSIISSPKSIINRYLLSSASAVWLGSRSYAVYLWHWPVIVFYKSYSGQNLSYLIGIALMVLTVLAADVTFRFLEQPLRRAASKRPKFVTRNLLAAQAALMLLALISWRGLIPEFSSDSKMYSDALEDWTYLDSLAVLGGSKPDKILFFGDSYVQQIYPRMLRRSQETRGDHRTIVFSTMPGCAPVPAINRLSDKYCADFVDKSFALAHGTEFSLVIIGGSWLGFMSRGDYYRISDYSKRPIDFWSSEGDFAFDALESQIASLTRSGKKVRLILEWPSSRKANPKFLYRTKGSNDISITMSEHVKRTAAINDRLRHIAQRAGATTIDPANFMCDSKECRFLNELGRPVFKDGSHINSSYARDSLYALDDIFSD